MECEFDVIVVGAGPAGSCCARRAAELGLSTLVLEKATFPRAKPCASGLSVRALAGLGAEIEAVVHDHVDTIRVDFGPRVSLRWQGAGRVLATTTRGELDPLLAGLAEDAGARFEFGRRVSEVVPNGAAVGVRVGSDRLSARFVVGADGPWSTVRRSIGVRPPRHGGAICVRAFPEDPVLLAPFHGVITFDLTAARRGYGWVFPKRDHLNVGVYRQAPLSAGLKSALDSFLARKRLDSWRCEGACAFPVPTDVRIGNVGRGLVVLAGDAAGMVDPITGEGITHAIASGRVAAEAIAEAVESGASPEPIYRSRLVREVIPHVNVIKRVGNLCYSAGPRALAFVVRAPALRSALMRLGPWGRLGPEGGRLLVETP